jgi:DNA-binding NtrC family response regulator
VIYVASGRLDRRGVLDRFEQAGIRTSAASDAAHALTLLRSQPAALVLVDLADDRVGLAVVRAIAGRYPAASIVALVDVSHVAQAGEALQCGASDLLGWPCDVSDVLALIANRRDRETGTNGSTDVPPDNDLVALSPAMKTLSQRAEQAARARGVLIAGEPGSGRGRLARVLHARRPWGGMARTSSPPPFVVENCSGNDTADIEQRLFGLASGDRQEGRSGRTVFERVARAGAIYRARGGTLCLLNVAEAPLRVQTRLARVLRDREADLADQPGTLVDLDLHVIVCADLHIDEAIADGRLRPDLYERVAQARIDVPPLRSRREDVPVLVVRLIGELSSEERRAPKRISRAALSMLAALPWRGNVSELKALLRLLLRVSDRPVIDLEDLLEHTSLEDAAVRVDLGLTLREAKARFEREWISAALARHEGRISDAARALGIQRTNLYRKLRELQMVKPRPSMRPLGEKYRC